MARDWLTSSFDMFVTCAFEECTEPIVIPVKFQLTGITWSSSGNHAATGDFKPDYSDVFRHAEMHQEGTWTLRG